MISLKQSFSELDRLELLQKASLECYRSAVEAVSEYAVDIDTIDTRRYRDDLIAIVRQVQAAESPEGLRQTRACFRGELQAYSAKTQRYLQTLEEKVTATAHALAEIVENVKRGGSESDRRLATELGRLHSISQVPEVAKICPELETAVATLEDSVGQLQRRNRVMVVQLRDEIKSLHQALDSAREEAGRDPITGVLNRAEMTATIRREIEQDRTFCLVFVWISNFDYIHRRYGWQSAEQVLTGFCEHLRAAAGQQTPTGRWGDDRFAILLHRSKPEAMWVAENLAQQLTGPYVIKEHDLTRDIALQLKTGVVERAAGTLEARLLSAADKLLVALETVAVSV